MEKRAPPSTPKKLRSSCASLLVAVLDAIKVRYAASELPILPAFRASRVRKLDAKTPVTLVKSDSGWTLIAKEGRPFRILKRLVPAITSGDGIVAERLAREYNAHVREQIIDILSTSLAKEMAPPRPRPVNQR